jgi:hypothetical protein
MPEYTHASSTIDSKPGVVNRKESIYGMTSDFISEFVEKLDYSGQQ